MNVFRRFLISAAAIAMLFLLFVYQADALGPKVSELAGGGEGNKHNLSAKAWPSGTTSYLTSTNYLATDNPNSYKATDASDNPKGKQICIFCHTPHSANVEGGAPLWNLKFSAETFSRYSSQTLEIRKNSTTRASAGYESTWQPDGSSKLCLSCHDGVATGTGDGQAHGLGNVLVGSPIAMVAGKEFIAVTEQTSFNPSTNKMKTGHHPVSFVYDANVRTAINALTAKNLTTPNDFKASSIGVVKVDKNGKMQCTTCHNAHQNQSDDTRCYLAADGVTETNCGVTDTRKVAPFWVYHNGANSAAQDRDAVCTTCHPLTSPATGNSGYTPPWSP